MTSKTGIAIAVMVTSFLLLTQCVSHRDSISYNNDIRPIFNKKCLPCHGGVKQQGGFSLLFEEEAFAKTESGSSAIIKGNAHKSELYKRIIHDDPNERMPKDAPPLTETEKKLIEDWIEDGADWEEHWSYINPTKKTIPIQEAEWATNEIDHFILEKLETLELEPAAEADKRDLVRRASLDLTGLPPSQELVDAYMADNSQEAFEKVVDTLLASKHFGERWAAMWLDLARYADSKGYEKDDHRSIWRFRDWVIDAFNRDLPFDKFTIEQLAGDLLPNPTREQLIATAFHRNTMTNDEGGTEDEEFRIASLIDRVGTTFEVWQGTTMACVQCHSHPYDPIKHEEFYEVMDIFNHTLDQDLQTEQPVLLYFEQDQADSIEQIVQYIEELNPKVVVAKDDLINNKITKAIFPKLSPGDCDDHVNVVFSGDGIATNWAQPDNSVKDKTFYFVFTDIDLTNLTDIKYWYSNNGTDSKIEVRLDSIGGEIINEYNFPEFKSNRWSLSTFSQAEAKVKPKTGKHNLIFEIINTTDEISSGMLSIGMLELKYSDLDYPEDAEKFQKQLLAFRSKADKTPIMRPKTDLLTRKTHLFERGSMLTLGQQVAASVPDAFHKSNDPEPTDRLSFANWLVSKDNPLTARVLVNRIWEQIFGVGIIESLEDFGTQSISPTHPELLDHLAVRFMEDHQWSIKSLLKEILLSSSYRQSSVTTSEKIEKDPFNRYLSRGARFRLSAEQIRDQALAVSGLLNTAIGGESVMPHQPQGIWQVVYNNKQWITKEDDSRYRRGLYTYWKRTAPYPSMMTFDSHSREFCMSRRIRTNTPLQALVTLNDPVYLQAAESLGNEMIKQGEGDLEKAIAWGYQTAMISVPDEDIIEVLTKLYKQSEVELENAGATASINEDEYNNAFQLNTPMTVVANAIMNLDGFIMKN